MKVAAIGDNCIDVYERIGKKYPTGNVVDTEMCIRDRGLPAAGAQRLQPSGGAFAVNHWLRRRPIPFNQRKAGGFALCGQSRLLYVLVRPAARLLKSVFTVLPERASAQP